MLNNKLNEEEEKVINDYYSALKEKDELELKISNITKEKQILSDALETGKLIFLRQAKAHSNPHAISLNDVVKVNIKNKMIIKNNFKVHIKAVIGFKNIHKNIINKVRYKGQTNNAFDTYALTSILDNPIIISKKADKIPSDTKSLISSSDIRVSKNHIIFILEFIKCTLEDDGTYLKKGYLLVIFRPHLS